MSQGDFDKLPEDSAAWLMSMWNYSDPNYTAYYMWPSSGRQWLYARGYITAHGWPKTKVEELRDEAREAADRWAVSRGFESLDEWRKGPLGRTISRSDRQP